MNKTQLYINGILADVSQDTVISITSQLWNIGDLRSRNISYTNRIKLPLTPNNNIIYENANLVNSDTRKPYTNVKVKIVQSGLEIITNATGLLKQVSDRFYHLEIYDRTLDFFEAIKGKYVDELDLELYGPFDSTFLNTYRNDLDPGGCPVIDYGRLFAPAIVMPNKEFSSEIYDPWYSVEDDSPFYVVGSTAWASSGGFVGVTLGAAGPGNVSQYLHGDYNFYQGYTYRLVLQFEVINATPNGSIQIEVHNESDGTFQSLGSTPANSAGTFYADHTFTADDDYAQIAIIASRVVGGGNRTFRLLNIDITPVNSIDLTPPFYIPTLNYFQTIRALIEGAGYTFDPDFSAADQTYFERLNIVFGKPKLEYNTRLTEQFRFKALASGTEVINLTTSAIHLISFTEVEYNGSAGWYNNTNNYVIPIIGFDIGVRFFTRIVVSVTVGAGDALSIYLGNGATIIQDEAGNNIIYPVITVSGDYTITLETPLRTYGSSSYGFSVQCTIGAAGNTTVQVLSGYAYSEISPLPVGRIHTSNLVLPDMLQTDFFADFLYRFGALVKESNSTLTVKGIQDIIEGRLSAKDWSQKRDVSKPQSIDFLYSQYARNNYFNDDPQTAEDATGIMEIDNENLSFSKTVYSSPFKAIEQIFFEGIKICRVPVFDFESNDPYKVSDNFQAGPRLIYMRDDETTDPTVEYNGVTQTQYNVATYGDPTSTDKATWQYFIDRFYPGLKTSLDSVKIVNRYYQLTEVDIQTLDQLKLMYDDNTYFIILKVENYVYGKSTKVQLLKVS